MKIRAFCFIVSVISCLFAVSTIASQAGLIPHALLDRIVPNGAVNSMALDKARHALYVGGVFTSYGYKTGGGAVFDSSGHLINHYPTFNGRVFASVSDGHGGFYVGGDFTLVNLRDSKYIAHINQHGIIDESFTPEIPATVRNLSITGTNLYVATDNQVYEVGLFSKQVNPDFSLHVDNSIYKMVADPFGYLA